MNEYSHDAERRRRQQIFIDAGERFNSLLFHQKELKAAALPPNVPDFLKAPASNAEREPELWAIFQTKIEQWCWDTIFLRTQDRASPNPREISVRIVPAPKGPVLISSFDNENYE